MMISPRISLASDLAIRLIVAYLVFSATSVLSEAVLDTHSTVVSAGGLAAIDPAHQQQLESNETESFTDALIDMQEALVMDDEGASSLWRELRRPAENAAGRNQSGRLMLLAVRNGVQNVQC
jgi:hypothetical protein